MAVLLPIAASQVNAVHEPPPKHEGHPPAPLAGGRLDECKGVFGQLWLVIHYWLSNRTLKFWQ